MIKLQEGQKVLDEQGNVYLIEKGDILQEGQLDLNKFKDGIEGVLNRDLKFRYQMLGRFISDIQAYLDTEFPIPEKRLWSGNAIQQADDLIALYNSFDNSEKPKWVSEKEIKEYAKELYNSVK